MSKIYQEMLVNKIILALLLSKAGEKVHMYESIQKMWLVKMIFEKILYFGKLVERALGR